MIQKISLYFSGVQIEMKKVTWLSKQEMMGSTVIVGVFSVLIAIFLFVVDFGVSQKHTISNPIAPSRSLIKFKEQFNASPNS